MPCSTLKGLTMAFPRNPAQNMTPPPPCCFLIWLPDDFPFSTHPSGPSMVTRHSYVQRTLVKYCFKYLTAQSIRFWWCNLVRGNEVTTFLTVPIFRRHTYWVVSGISGIPASLKMVLLVELGFLIWENSSLRACAAEWLLGLNFEAFIRMKPPFQWTA